MLKKYVSRTDVSFHIALSGGGNAHVSFTPMTGGGSVYYTADADVQHGLEAHAKYGKLFRLSPIEEKSPSPTLPQVGGGEAADTGEELNEVAVSCTDDAKDYLSEKYGVSRTKMRSLKAIQEAAARHGIVFTGL